MLCLHSMTELNYEIYFTCLLKLIAANLLQTKYYWSGLGIVAEREPDSLIALARLTSGAGPAMLNYHLVCTYKVRALEISGRREMEPQLNGSNSPTCTRHTMHII